MNLQDCEECKKPSYLVNKRYKLCKTCNEIRLYGRTKQEMYIERARSRPRKKYAIKQKTANQSQIDKEYSKMIEQLSYTREKKCTGCGQYSVALSNSHIISRAHCKSYGLVELIADPENIAYHCLTVVGSNGCHQIWENPTRRNTLLDYEQNMTYIRSKSEELYQKYLVK